MRILETHRLYIERVGLDDCSFIYELMNTDSWIKYIGDRQIENQDLSKAYIKNSYLYNYDTYGFGFYKLILKDSNVPIGISGFAKRKYLKHPDIGFGLLPDFEGLGYAYEASVAVLNYGFLELEFTTVGAITMRSNKSSIKLIERLGLLYLKTIKTEGEELLYYEISKSGK